MTVNERIICGAQIVISILLLIGFFFVFSIVIFGRATIPEDQLRLADTLFGSLCTLVGLCCNYWFARQRSDGAKASA